MDLVTLRKLWTNPPRDYAPVPFWFWNGPLTDAEIRRQLQEFQQRGIGGVIPHARVPLPEEIGFLTEPWFHFIGVCLEEARRLGLTVWLYDEGMYPSGSAAGRVVEGRPELRCQAVLKRRNPTLSQPSPLNSQPPPGAWRGEPGQWQPAGPDFTESLLTAGEYDYVRLYPNAPIRGLGYGLPPLAADLLNPAATRRFLQVGYEPYWQRFREYFGTTIRGFFTDEPHLLGRSNQNDLRPWTPDFPRFFQSLHGWDLLPHLPALWEDDPATEPIRLAYRHALDELLQSAYYAPLAEWCAARGIALLGHPSGMGELAHLRSFQIPGQDVVWKQVTPTPTPQGGPDSVLGKIGSSAAHIYGRARNANEVYGAYGWELSAPEMKWLADWLLVRGVDFLIPHAFYYTLDGSAKHERPPDVGPGNLWWPHYRQFSEYVTRLSALLSQGRPVCDLAIYDQGNETSPRAGYWLLQLQRDFDYLERALLEAETCTVEGGQLWLEHVDYRVLILDGVERLPLASMRKIHAFVQAGGIALALEKRPAHALEPGQDAEVARLAREVWPDGSEWLVGPTRAALGRILDRCVSHDARCEPATPHVRVLHRRLPAGDAYFFTNESTEESVTCSATPRGAGTPEAWDPETGAFTRLWHYVRDGTSVTLPLRLRPAETQVFLLTRERDPLKVIDTNLYPVTHAERTPTGVQVTGWTEHGGPVHALALDGFAAFRADAVVPPPPAPLEITGEWRVTGPAGPHSLPALTSWTEWTNPTYSGSQDYEIRFTIPEAAGSEDVEWTLDLGKVAEWAAAWLNEVELGARLWPPFRWPVQPLPGENHLRVRVWNSLANAYTGAALPSGLLGPVRLEARRRVTLHLEPAPAPEFPVSLA